MSANLPEIGDEVVTTGEMGRPAGEHHIVRAIGSEYVWTRRNLRHDGATEPTAREHFWLVFQKKA